jgi:hypothetical protein
VPRHSLKCLPTNAIDSISTTITQKQILLVQFPEPVEQIWQATGKDREEVLRIGADKLQRFGNDLQSQVKGITDEIIKTLQRRVAFAGGALNAVRSQIEAALIRVLPQPQLDPNNINKPNTVPPPKVPSHTGHSQPTENFDPNQPSSVPVSQVSSDTCHAPPVEGFSTVFSQEQLIGIQQPDGIIRLISSSLSHASSTAV